MNKILFLSLLPLFAFVYSCKKECTKGDTPYKTQRISAIRVLENGNPTSELHFIYDTQNRISKLVRRLNNNDMFIDISYYANQIDIDKIGSAWESQLLNTDGYPDTIFTSSNSFTEINYISPGLLAEVKRYVEPNYTLSQTTAYLYTTNRLDEVRFTDHKFGQSYTDTVKYQDGKMVSFGHFRVSYSGNCVAQIEATGSPTVSHTKDFEYQGDCHVITHLEENTIYPTSATTKTYVFEYEDGEGTFPFLWQTPFYRIAGMPDFIGFAWNYGGI